MKFYVWGTGPAKSNLIREAEQSDAAVKTALRHGMSFNSSDDWAVEVEATEDTIDAATRFDPAVKGWVEADEDEDLYEVAKSFQFRPTYTGADGNCNLEQVIFSRIDRFDAGEQEKFYIVERLLGELCCRDCSRCSLIEE